MSKEYSSQGEVISQEVSRILVSDIFLSSLPKIDNVSKVSGGVAHQVFQINAARNRYYLKIRGMSFAAIPEIACNPNDIDIEYQALEMFYQVAPDNFPRVLSYNQDNHYLVLEDAIPNGEKLEDLFLKQKTTSKMFFNFGQTLAKVHRAASCCDKPVRDDNDQTYYRTVLGHRFGYRNNPTLNELMESLSILADKQLVLGDVCPKNIGVNDLGKHFMFFDLETAHQGDAVFDYAYFLGHILIHALTTSEIELDNVTEYVKGYGTNKFDDLLVKRIALGTALYRLKSIIPYPTGLDINQTLDVEKKIEAILPYNLAELDWTAIIALISHEKN